MSQPRRIMPLPLGGEHGLPYSRGLMARALMAVGVAPDRAYALARRVGDDLAARSSDVVEVDRLESLAIESLGEVEGREALRQLRRYQELRELDLPIVIHTREAAEDTMRILRDQAEGLTVVMHCFSLPEHLDECGAALVLARPVIRAVADCDDMRRRHVVASRVQVPERPPDFTSSRTLSIETPRSMPLVMSMRVRPATAAAVSASISTPV